MPPGFIKREANPNVSGPSTAVATLGSLGITTGLLLMGITGTLWTRGNINLTVSP